MAFPIHFLRQRVPRWRDASEVVDEKVNIVVAAGREVFKLGERGVVDGYPQRIRDVFPGLPDYIDAALHWKQTYLRSRNGRWYTAPARTYFFKVRVFKLVTATVPKLSSYTVVFFDICWCSKCK